VWWWEQGGLWTNDGKIMIHSNKNLLHVGWRNNANYPDFCENHQFCVVYCVTLADVLYVKEFLTHDSC